MYLGSINLPGCARSGTQTGTFPMLMLHPRGPEVTISGKSLLSRSPGLTPKGSSGYVPWVIAAAWLLCRTITYWWLLLCMQPLSSSLFKAQLLHSQNYGIQKQSANARFKNEIFFLFCSMPVEGLKSSPARQSPTPASLTCSQSRATHPCQPLPCCFLGRWTPHRWIFPLGKKPDWHIQPAAWWTQLQFLQINQTFFNIGNNRIRIFSPKQLLYCNLGVFEATTTNGTGNWKFIPFAKHSLLLYMKKYIESLEKTWMGVQTLMF